MHEQIIEQYREMGRRWVAGEVSVEEIELNDKKLIFHENQKKFLNDRNRYCLYGGAMASGKTTAFIVKMIMLCLWFPNNRVLLGRKTRALLEMTVLRDFFDICPPSWVEYKQGLGVIKFFNGSEILLKGLDALQEGAQSDIKKAEQEIKSLNLGAVFIDQLEEIEQRVFFALTSRLRRDVGFRQMNFTINPTNHWSYDYFKANPRPDTSLIESSMLDNKANLPQDFIEDQLKMPKNYVERFVYGNWSPDVMTDKSVFAQEHVTKQGFYTREPVRVMDGIKIYKEPELNHTYQIGVDTSEGSIDPCCIQVVDVNTGEQVCSFAGYVPINVQINKIITIGGLYSIDSQPLVIIEANASGTAVIEGVKNLYNNLYQRESFDYREQRDVKKLGFQTNVRTKSLLIDRMQTLLQADFPKVRDKDTLEEMKTFIWSNEARMQGAGAQHGFHDDRIMALMMAFWRVEAKTHRESMLERIIERERKNKIRRFPYV